MSDNPHPKNAGRLIGTAIFAIWPTLFSFAYNVLAMMLGKLTGGEVILSTLACWLVFWVISWGFMSIMDDLRKVANTPREAAPDDMSPDNGGNTPATSDGDTANGTTENADNQRGSAPEDLIGKRGAPDSFDAFRQSEKPPHRKG